MILPCSESVFGENRRKSQRLLFHFVQRTLTFTDHQHSFHDHSLDGCLKLQLYRANQRLVWTKEIIQQMKRNLILRVEREMMQMNTYLIVYVFPRFIICIFTYAICTLTR